VIYLVFSPRFTQKVIAPLLTRLNNSELFLSFSLTTIETSLFRFLFILLTHSNVPKSKQKQKQKQQAPSSKQQQWQEIRKKGNTSQCSIREDELQFVIKQQRSASKYYFES